MSMDSDARKLAAKAKKAGWRIEGGGDRHYKWIPPDGTRQIIVPTSGSSHRNLISLRRVLRQKGVI